MSKNILNDIISSRKKNLSFQRQSQHEDYNDEEYDTSPKKGRIKKWIIGGVTIIAFFIFGFSLIFSGASVNITPRTEPFSFDDVLEAKKHSLGAPVGLSFDVLEITESESQKVPATGTEYVEQKASGVIIVFNEYSASSQKLINNTRFEAPNGNIYRIKQAIVVPGKTQSGGEVTPGAVEVSVYADEPGESYNIGLVDFSVPGLKSSPLYNGIYARSKTPISGGVVGEKKKISQADREKALRQLKITLSEKLSKRIFDEKSAGFVIYDDGIFIDFSESSSDEGEGGVAERGKDSVSVTLKGTARAVMFQEAELAGVVADTVINNFDNRPVRIPELDAFRFTLLDKSTADIESDTSLSFSFAGSGNVVWVIDKNEVRLALVSQPKKEFQKILASFLNIERAATVIRPFWNRSFPDNENKITIELATPVTAEIID